MKDITAIGLMVNLFFVISLGAILIEQKNQYTYKVEALQATQDCESCQMVILAKGRD